MHCFTQRPYHLRRLRRLDSAPSAWLWRLDLGASVSSLYCFILNSSIVAQYFLFLVFLFFVLCTLLRGYYRTPIGNPMLEVEPTGQRGLMTTGSGRNGRYLKKLHRQYLHNEDRQSYDYPSSHFFLPFPSFLLLSLASLYFVPLVPPSLSPSLRLGVWKELKLPQRVQAEPGR